MPRNEIETRGRDRGIVGVDGRQPRLSKGKRKSIRGQIAIQRAEFATRPYVNVLEKSMTNARILISQIDRELEGGLSARRKAELTIHKAWLQSAALGMIDTDTRVSTIDYVLSRLSVGDQDYFDELVDDLTTGRKVTRLHFIKNRVVSPVTGAVDVK